MLRQTEEANLVVASSYNAVVKWISMNSLYFLCKYSTMVSALVCHTRDGSSILLTCSNASMAEGIMHQTLNLAIKVRVLVGVQK